MSGLNITFANSGIDRCAELRADRDQLAAIAAEAHILPVWQHRLLARDGRAALFRASELSLDAGWHGRAVFLGRRGGQYLFALDLAEDSGPLPAITGGEEFRELRELMTELDADDAALMAYARAMLAWQQRHAYCGHCGNPAVAADAGFVMVCSNPPCAQRSFPRLDPAIIVLAHHQDRCLLGRQASWPEGRFSTIAGFVEPGEGLEDAVRREVAEETNICVGRCHYLASQPWPFPSALMIGFHAEALSTEIRLNDAELAEARWLSREQLVAREVTLPPVTSVAYRLIEIWFDQYDGPPLQSFGLPAPPLRVLRPDERS